MANRNDHVMTNDGLRRTHLAPIMGVPRHIARRHAQRTFTAPTPVATPTVTSKPSVLSTITSTFRRWFGMS